MHQAVIDLDRIIQELEEKNHEETKAIIKHLNQAKMLIEQHYNFSF